MILNKLLIYTKLLIYLQKLLMYLKIRIRQQGSQKSQDKVKPNKVIT